MVIDVDKVSNITEILVVAIAVAVCNSFSRICNSRIAVIGDCWFHCWVCNYNLSWESSSNGDRHSDNNKIALITTVSCSINLFLFDVIAETITCDLFNTLFRSFFLSAMRIHVRTRHLRLSYSRCHL